MEMGKEEAQIRKLQVNEYDRGSEGEEQMKVNRNLIKRNSEKIAMAKK